jgi:hypothetical protein
LAGFKKKTKKTKKTKSCQAVTGEPGNSRYTLAEVIIALYSVQHLELLRVE